MDFYKVLSALGVALLIVAGCFAAIGGLASATYVMIRYLGG